MLIEGNELKERIRNRLPFLKKEEVSRLFDSLIKVLIGRFLIGQPTIIDNFGILSRKKSKPRRVINITTGKPQEIVSNTICLRVNHAFLAFFKDYKNRERLKRKIIESSKIAYKENNKRNLI